jgi:hypothetical protein
MATPQDDKKSLTEILSTWGTNFTTNTAKSFSDMSAKDWIRIIIIVGTYSLIRPYILKLGARAQNRAHEKDAADDTGAEVHPNELRTGKKIEIPGVADSDEEEDGVEGESVADWGKKARVRQRRFIRGALEKAEKKLADEQEAESDKEIEEFLVD